jgi:glycosyltransferase involved in cell wall biosynthesis
VKVLVYPPTLELGGSQLNAIELAAALAERGHDLAVVAARPGPLTGLLADKGLRLLSLDLPGVRRPAPRAMLALARVVRRERPDVVHAYEAPTALEAFFGTGLARRAVVVGSILSMTIPARFPRSIPLVVGTSALAAQASRAGHRSVHLIEPPVDTRRDRPDADVDTGAFLRRHRLDDDRLRIVIVSRLERQLKLEGLERLIAAAAPLAGDHPVRLVVVGGGTALPLLRQQGEEVNARLGREAVVFTGPLTDPRPAYAAAHVVAGMGGSILRGMAFAKPVVVLGERGFSQVVAPETVQGFLDEGFYGTGDGDLDPEPLRRQLDGLLADPERRSRLGSFGRALVCDRFDLGVAAASLEGIYQRAMAGRHLAGAELAEAGRALAWIGGFKAKQQLLQWRARRLPGQAHE